ncbi:Hypothetical predicted protein [Mytilus galloprovincialis]|uniref:Uncharacterized protein n=1 Tax=Mytilus galloprovincialis TaxID=29158 RepID=A0A8B6GUU0_MYTGA|nr:Hypothetical predicted protein [Mytilus galloprovincialis]
MCHVMRRSDLNGRITGNAAVDDHVANAICAQTDGAYMWRPNTEQEAKAVLIELNILNYVDPNSPCAVKLYAVAGDFLVLANCTL